MPETSRSALTRRWLCGRLTLQQRYMLEAWPLRTRSPTPCCPPWAPSAGRCAASAAPPSTTTRSPRPSARSSCWSAGSPGARSPRSPASWGWPPTRSRRSSPGSSRSALVVRTTDPDDRRVGRLSLSPSAQARADAAREQAPRGARRGARRARPRAGRADPRRGRRARRARRAAGPPRPRTATARCPGGCAVTGAASVRHRRRPSSWPACVHRFGDARGRRRARPDRRGRRGRRPARAQRRRQDHHAPGDRHAAAGAAGPGHASSGSTSPAPPRRCAGGSATCPSSCPSRGR